MVSYLFRRVLQGCIVLLCVSFICFAIFQYLGDPIRSNYNVQELTAERVEQIKKQLGLDQPFHVQYVRWLSRVLHGEFGLSYRQRLPVLPLILERAPATLELATLSMILGVLFGMVLGVWSSLRPRSWAAKGTSVISLLGISTPTFVVGLLLILAFSVTLHWLPSFGRGETVALGSWKTGLLTWSGWEHLLMPVITLGAFQVGVMLRLTHTGMIESLSQDYVRTAWAKGSGVGRVVLRHALRNALIPIITMIGLNYGEMIAFSIVTESIFQWPGLGNLLLQSVFASDQPIVVAYIVLAALTILTLNLLVDLAYLVLNPKIRYE